ncbi:MAG: hypothetical protein ACI8WW_002361, partial [Oceanospirillaceae bacterium]
MKTSSENNFERQWKRKFENASLPPPDGMWNRIETDLAAQKKRTPFFLLWGIPAYVTSGIAAMLILALGGWFLFNDSEEQVPAEMAKAPEPVSIESEGKTIKPVQPEQRGNSNAEEIVNEDKNKSYKKNNRNAVAKVALRSTKGQNYYSQSELMNEKVNRTSSINEAIPVKLNTPQIASEGTSTFFESIAYQLSKLTGKPYEKYPVRYVLTRNKLAYNELITEVEDTKKRKSRSWVGLVSGLSPFKPNFQNGGLDQLASTNAGAFSANDANFTTQRGPQGSQGTQGSMTGSSPLSPNSENSFGIPSAIPIQQFANGRAFNFGIQAGRQLTKRLALESGVRYIQGSSPVNTNVYTLNERTGEINTFVQDYLTQDKTLSNVVVASAETLNNSYEYLSLPVQLAYEIPLLNKLNLEITGGISADMFLQNTLQSETTDVALLNARNSAFRTLGVSGLGGVRLNYLFDEKWELIIGSAFQQALVSNLESGSSAQLRPQMLGINYGVNYHF